jgi:succinate dehydrogenase hydrophobic anchor subunit
MAKRPRRILRRRWATTEGWRDTRAGMWAWLAQRAAAVGLLAVIVLHLRDPFWRPVQATLLGLVLLHGLLGVRAILLDFGLPVRWHRGLLVLALLLGAAIFAAVWGWRWS